jgi:hypothetical protein
MYSFHHWLFLSHPINKQRPSAGLDNSLFIDGGINAQMMRFIPFQIGGHADCTNIRPQINITLQ